MSPRLFVVFFVAVLALAGCARHDGDFSARVTLAPREVAATAEPVAVAWDAAILPIGPKIVADSDPPYLLDSGDRLRVFVYGQPNLSRLYTVDHVGFISIPLIGAVKARGQTTFDVQRTIAHQLGRKYVKDPQVTVDIYQNRPFFILGEVRSPGQYPYVSGMTVQSAVAIAGGFSERANEGTLQITRRINGVIAKVDVPRDQILLPGDTVYVYERWF